MNKKTNIVTSDVRLLSFLLLGILLTGFSAHAQESGGAGLKGQIAYYPSHDTLEFRTEETQFVTGDGTGGLKAEYFDNKQFKGEPVHTTVHQSATVNPPDSLSGNEFALRLTGRLSKRPWTGPYQFRFKHDDKIRVQVNGERIYHHSKKRAGANPRRVRTFEKGSSPRIEIEYRNTGGSAKMNVSVIPLGKRVEELFQTPDVKTGLQAAYFDGPGFDTVNKTTVKKKVEHNGRGGVWIRFTGTLGPAPKAGDYVFTFYNRDAVRLWLDGTKELDLSERPHGGPHNSFTSVRYHLDRGETVPIRVELERRAGAGTLFHTRMVPRMALSTQRDLSTSGTVRIENDEGKTVQRHNVTFNRFGDRFFAEIDPLEPGMHTIKLTGEEYGNVVTEEVLEQDFAWEGNDLGLTKKIYPPFEPIQIEDRTLDVVLRRYDLGGLGLPEQIHARGQGSDSKYRSLLAEPVTLKANGESISNGNGEFTHTGDRKVVYEGSASHPVANVRTRVRTEFDGCMRVDLTLKPGTEQKKLKSMTLDVPLKDEMAPLAHVVKGTPPIRNNPAGMTWEGSGRVWSSKQMRSKWPGNFQPYIWLGGPERGLSWFADNEKGWVVDWKGNSACQTLHRNGDTLTLRIHLVQKPITLKESRTITFGLMASPAKPMPENWRKIGRPEAKRIHFLMGHRFGLPGTFNAKYPLNKDWSPLKMFHRARRGEDVNKEKFVDRWTKRNLHDEMSKNLKKRMRNLVGLGVGAGSKMGSDTLFTAYVEEFRATTLWHDEMKTYWSEWTRKFEIPADPLFDEWDNRPTKTGHLKWFRGTGAAVPSYRDFMAWVGSKWLKNGAGVYFDNTFMEAAYNLVNTSAYVRPDGQIQPSAQIWARRKYLRRIWNLHQKLYDPKTPQIMMLHMTNGHVVPYMVWNQVNMDLEWKLPGAKPFQKKFSPAVLRAETLGRKTGNYPLAMTKPGKGNKPEDMSKEEYKRLKRTYRAGLLVHEVRWTPSLTTRRLPESLLEFGYGTDEVRVWNYWKRNAPMKVDDDQCKWLLLKRGGELFILFCTWNKSEAQVTTTLDLDRLDVDVSNVIDAGTGDRITRVEDGQFTVHMPGYGVRMVLLKN